MSKLLRVGHKFSSNFLEACAKRIHKNLHLSQYLQAEN
jgi:hypothetical protein